MTDANTTGTARPLVRHPSAVLLAAHLLGVLLSAFVPGRREVARCWRRAGVPALTQHPAGRCAAPAGP